MRHQQCYENLFTLERKTLYSLRKKSSNCRHPLNGKPVFIRERLAYHDAVENMNLITTRKCQVKVLVSGGDRKVFEQIIDLKPLEMAENQAVIKQQDIRGSKDFKRRAVSELYIKFSPT